MSSRRAKKWKIKTDPDLLSPKLRAVHELSSKTIAETYASIDSAYAQVAKILDKEGVMAHNRVSYRSFTEELWKLTHKYSGKTLGIEADAISIKRQVYGCDLDILKKIGLLFGLTIGKYFTLEVEEVAEADKVSSGLDADRSAYPEVGYIYWATDTNILYLCAIAGSWVAIPDAKIATHTAIPDAHHSVHEKTLADHPLSVIPVLDNSKYPNAVLKDGPRVMTGNLDMDGKFMLNMPLKHICHFSLVKGEVDVVIEFIPAGVLTQDFHISQLVLAVDIAPGDGKSVTVSVTDGVTTMTVTLTGAQTSGSTTENAFDVDVSARQLVLNYGQTADGDSDNATVVIIYHYIPT